MSPDQNPTSELTRQFLNFAVSGRVEHRVESPSGDSDDEFFSVLTLAAGTTTVGVGFGVLLARSGSLTTLATFLGLGIVAIGLAVLLPPLGNVLRHPMPSGVTPIPASMTAGSLIRPGNWVFHRQAWVRVEQVGFSNDGYTALLSTDEVIELNEPLITAGGEFAADQTAEIR